MYGWLDDIRKFLAELANRESSLSADIKIIAYVLSRLLGCTDKSKS